MLLNTVTYTRTSLGPVIEITWPLYCDTLYDYILDNYNYCDATYNTTHEDATYATTHEDAIMAEQKLLG